MQIMPATGKLLSKKVGLGYSRAKLTENDFYNLQLGSFILQIYTMNSMDLFTWL